jgi:hypothetical protein
MINQAVPQQNPDSVLHLKTVFEKSLAVLSEGKDALAKDTRIGRASRASTPIYINAADLQKRALEDAAHALATLWKVQEPGRSKPQNRPLPSTR